MAMKLVYYGQNDGSTTPDVTLTGDPGTDQPVLTAAGYLGGKIMALKTSATTGRGVVIVPADGATANAKLPYAVLINGPGEFAGAIGPAGSKKAPVVRALFQALVDNQAYVASPSGGAYVVGAYVYCSTGAEGLGNYTTTVPAGGSPIAICTHIPTATEAWLGVASLL